MKRSTFGGLLACVAAGALTAPALAQIGDASAAETAPTGNDIVVTARRTAERLQDVPISVSAITGDQIAASGARGLEDIARQTPGFSFERTTGTLAQPVIRGQAQSRLTNPVQNVATFFNGIYLQRAYQVDSDLLDLDRIEVIKGPQSALFGRNAFAGAISYVTRRPDLEQTRVRAEATIGDFGRRELKGSVSLPIGGIAAISVASSASEFDGTWSNNNTAIAGVTGGAVRTNGRLNGYDNSGFLIQLRIKPEGPFEFNAFWNRRNIFVESPANYQQSAIGLISGVNVNNCNPFEAPAQARLGTNALFCGALQATPILAAGEARSPGLVADPRTFGQDSRTNVVGASVDLALTDAFGLAYSFGYADATALGIGTLSRDPQRGVTIASPFNGRVLFDSRGNGDISSTSHELRASFEQGGVRILAGGYLADVDDFDYGASFAATPNSNAALNDVLFPAGTLFPPGYSATKRNERVRALFGLASVEVATGLRVTLEGRQTWERVRQQAAQFPSRTLIATPFEREFRYFTPRFTIDYKPSSDVLIYASAARGVKSGGFNANATLPAEQVYEPEKNWTYELGVKSTLMGGRLTLNAAAYYVDWTSLQFNRAQTNGTLGTPLIIGNVSGAKVKGIEAQGVLRLGGGFTVNAALSYSEARFNEDAIDPVIPRALCQNPATLPAGSAACPYNDRIGGRTIPRAPAFQANGGIAWRGVLSDDFALTARVDAAHQSRLYTDNTNTAWAPSRTIVDASIGVEQDAWSIRAFVRNALDARYVSYAFATFAGSGAGSGVTYAPLLGDRRTFGVTVAIRR